MNIDTKYNIPISSSFYTRTDAYSFCAVFSMAVTSYDVAYIQDELGQGQWVIDNYRFANLKDISSLCAKKYGISTKTVGRVISKLTSVATESFWELDIDRWEAIASLLPLEMETKTKSSIVKLLVYLVCGISQASMFKWCRSIEDMAKDLKMSKNNLMVYLDWLRDNDILLRQNYGIGLESHLWHPCYYYFTDKVRRLLQLPEPTHMNKKKPKESIDF